MISYFRQAFEALRDPIKWPSSHGFTYATSTSTSVLRKHLDRYHKDEYLKLAKEKGWTTTLPSVKLQVSIAPANLKPRIAFSPDQVLQKLVHFIAANDRVNLRLSSYVHLTICHYS